MSLACERVWSCVTWNWALEYGDEGWPGRCVPDVVVGLVAFASNWNLVEFAAAMFRLGETGDQLHVDQIGVG